MRILHAKRGRIGRLFCGRGSFDEPKPESLGLWLYAVTYSARSFFGLMRYLPDCPACPRSRRTRGLHPDAVGEIWRLGLEAGGWRLRLEVGGQSGQAEGRTPAIMRTFRSSAVSSLSRRTRPPSVRTAA